MRENPIGYKIANGQPFISTEMIKGGAGDGDAGMLMVIMTLLLDIVLIHNVVYLYLSN